ncbi:cytochrome P450 [Collybia nuda]|uniref:Cytochrome P450 n=1 Tax=Collybia nuda TaxID=64659 RepID=A0A9P6C9Y7_9AGAR|nr:cytochrome P450 [Collybia nuda]
MALSSLLLSFVCFSLVVYVDFRGFRNSYRHLPLPPGPKKLPLVGNLFNVPTKLAWVTYHRWYKDLQTDIIHLSVAGTSIVVVDKAELQMQGEGVEKSRIENPDMPFEATKQNVENGNATPCFASHCLEKSWTSQDPAYEESIIRNAAWGLYLGWISRQFSMVAAIGSCVLGLLTNPKALKKAQQEMDSILGFGQLPGFEGQDSLPYVTAVVKEALGWRDVAPLGFPHYTTADDEYNGYRIPAGSIVMANSWAMLHDETIYPEPFEFNPDRYIKDGKLDPK